MDTPSLTRDQLIGQIRFQLSGLSARSGHHEFEEACRHLAHARIAANILPATGPVSAGGDQGRDFETFHSYLAETLGDRGWFAGMVSAGPIAALCTLQTGAVAGKVRNDVAKICGAGTAPAPRRSASTRSSEPTCRSPSDTDSPNRRNKSTKSSWRSSTPT
jgi:hypothetical protein